MRDDRIARKAPPGEGQICGTRAIQSAEPQDAGRPESLRLAASAAYERVELVPGVASLGEKTSEVHTVEYDDELTITTPEGVDVHLTLAGVGSRFLSALVDVIIQAAAIAGLAALVFLTNGFGAGRGPAIAIFTVGFFVLFWGYDVFFEVLASGRTPGKRWNGLRVVRSGGRRSASRERCAQPAPPRRLAALVLRRRMHLDPGHETQPAARRPRRRLRGRARAARVADPPASSQTRAPSCPESLRPGTRVR